MPNKCCLPQLRFSHTVPYSCRPDPYNPQETICVPGTWTRTSGSVGVNITVGCKTVDGESVREAVPAFEPVGNPPPGGQQ